jgi:hypothetical protein
MRDVNADYPRQQSRGVASKVRPGYISFILLLALAGAVRVGGQGLDLGFLSRASPSPAFLTPEPARYNLKFGKLTARIRAAMQFEYSDNINLAATGSEWDLAFAPHGEVGFVYPITEAELLEVNIGLGYTWYLYHPAVSSINIDPKTRFDYRLRIIHPIELRLYDSINVITDPTSRPDLSGLGSRLVDFRILNNTLGALLNWQPTSKWRFSGGYSYGITRSLTEEFQTLDLDTHTFSAGAFYTVSPRLTVGLNGTYSFMNYSTNFSNNAQSYTIGPMAVFRPTEFISLTAAAGYSEMHFSQNGLIGDTSQGNGSLAAQVSVQHKFNRLISHDLTLSNGRTLGLDSNFNENFVAQYGVSARVTGSLTLRSSFSFSNVRGSGLLGENAQQYLFYIGTGLRLTRLWSTGIGYTFVLKNSDFASRDYLQNRLTLDISREF